MIQDDPLFIFENDKRDLIDTRTVNALRLNANIHTIKDLVDYCSDGNNERKFESIKGLGKKGVKKLNKLVDYLRDAGFFKEDNDLNKAYELTADSRYQSSLSLYSKYLSLRTINSLSDLQIFTVEDLLSNKGRYIYGAKGLGKKGLKEIEVFISYINTSSSENKEPIKDRNIKDILSDNRLLNILNFHSIYSLNQLRPYIEDFSKFNSLRYLTNEDYNILKALYVENTKNITINEKTFSTTFIDLVNNFSEIDGKIFKDRILGDVTLAEVGKKLGITRERVRQKQKNIEAAIIEHGNLFMNQNPEILAKLLNIIESYGFVFLPQNIKLFDFLGFPEDNVSLLFISLKGLNGLRGEIINNQIYCIFSGNINLSGIDLINLYTYINRKIHNNNDDINIEDLYYECKLDNVFAGKCIKSSVKEGLINNLGAYNEIEEDDENFYNEDIEMKIFTN